MTMMRAVTMITGSGPTVSYLFTGSKSSISSDIVVDFTIVKVAPEIVSGIKQLAVSIIHSL